MCGITGFYALKKDAFARLTKIAQSTQKLFLRGPDNGNIYCEERIALGHRRLSIIDTTDHASQPMKDNTNRYVLIFNGEIYNFKFLAANYLKQIFESVGIKNPTSDTEVLLYLLIEYGTECLKWLSGFFAFSFYDTQTGKMILARDRFGKKPLLYYSCDQYFAFASEMKSLLEWDIPKELDYTVLHQYLQLNYVPQPQSMLKGVAKLKPGHYMIYDESGLQAYESFYEIKIKPELYGEYSYEQAKDRLVTLMDNSVQERMISDVPLGAFLSGGIDSSVIVALASRHTKQLSTFSVGYKNNPFFDETSYARLVADRYKTNHTVFSLTNDDFLEHVFNVLDYIDEPFADSSAIPEYILCHLTRKHVTVALSGDGGDEVFSGYNKHAAEWKIRQNTLTNYLVTAGLPIWKIMPKGHNNKITNLFRQLYRFAEGASLPPKDRYWRWASINAIGTVNHLLCPAIRNKVNTSLMEAERHNILSYITEKDFNEVLEADMHLVLTGDMLVKVDMMSMANSLEVRSPFLDHHVVDFAFSLPSAYKIDGTMKKKILQDAFRTMLPPEIYNRPKHGFEIPLLDWFRKELWDLINNDLLSKSFIENQGIFDVTAIEQLKARMQSSGPGDSVATIWAVIVFQYWWKKYLFSENYY